MSNIQLQEASELLKRGENNQALMLIRGILREDGENVEALWLMAKALDDKPKKIQCLEKILELVPTHKDASLMLTKLIPERTPSIAELMHYDVPKIEENTPKAARAIPSKQAPSTNRALLIVAGVAALIFIFAMVTYFDSSSGSNRERASLDESALLQVGDSRTVSVSTDESTDIEFYADELVTITVKGLRGFDPVVEVLNSEGNQLAYNDDHLTTLSYLDDLDSAVQYVRVSGRGTIRVSAYADTGAGSATISIMAANIEDISVGRIEVGETRTLSLSENGMAELTLNTQGTITIAAQGIRGFDPVLQLYNAAGELISSNDDHDVGYSINLNLNSYDSLLEDVAINGRVYIRVYEYANSAGEVSITVR